MCASDRLLLSYEILDDVGVARDGLGQLLEPFQSLLSLNNGRPLSC